METSYLLFNNVQRRANLFPALMSFVKLELVQKLDSLKFQNKHVFGSSFQNTQKKILKKQNPTKIPQKMGTFRCLLRFCSTFESSNCCSAAGGEAKCSFGGFRVFPFCEQTKMLPFYLQLVVEQFQKSTVCFGFQ